MLTVADNTTRDPFAYDDPFAPLTADEEEERREWEERIARLGPPTFSTAQDLAREALAELYGDRKPKTEPAELLRALGLKQIQQRGKELSACCPFHDDRVPSFSMNAETGQWFCHAGCGSGNATTLLARKLDIPTGQAHARLMEGTPLEPRASAGTRPPGAGVLQNENFGRPRRVRPRKGRCRPSRPRGPTVLLPSPSGARGIRAQVHPFFNPAW
jgi:hypothetical protein